MARPTIVYSYRSGWWSLVVAATTKKAAREALGLTQGEFNGYVGETGNEIDCAIALSDPGYPFIQPIDARKDDKLRWWRFNGTDLRPWDRREADVVITMPEDRHGG